MPRVYLSLGSNINREHNLRAGINALKTAYGNVELSTVFESEPVGFKGTNFYNLVAAIETNQRVGQLAAQLRAIEEANGRDRHGPKFSPRTLDIDILTYGTQNSTEEGITLPREEILSNAFVLQPLAELAPSEIHPGTGQSYAALWQAYDKSRQKLWPVPFNWTE